MSAFHQRLPLVKRGREGGTSKRARARKLEPKGGNSKIQFSPSPPQDPKFYQTAQSCVRVELNTWGNQVPAKRLGEFHGSEASGSPIEAPANSSPERRIANLEQSQAKHTARIVTRRRGGGASAPPHPPPRGRGRAEAERFY